MPQSWHDNEETGGDWMNAFMEHNRSTIFTRSPKAANLSGTASYDKISKIIVSS